MILKKNTYAWYAIYTRVNQEKKILSTLEELNVECYLPLKKTLKQWSDRKKWIEEPLFRCYIFVRVSNVEFFKVLHTSGVVNYVSFGGRAQPIPNNQIEGVRTFVEQDRTEVIITKESIEPGTKAEVLYGPLKGVQGEIVKFNGKFRILIRIPMMGYCLHANISKDEIKIIKPQSISANGKHLQKKEKSTRGIIVYT